MRSLLILVALSVVTACGGGGGSSSARGSGVASTPAPTVNLSGSVSSVRASEPFTLTWSSSNATSCTASGAWSGSKSISGTEEITEANAGNYTYTLSCSGAGGSTSASVNIEMTQPVIRIDSTDSTYRTPEGGDQIIYNFDLTVRGYGFDGLLGENSDNGTIDSEYFVTALPLALQEPWGDFEVRTERSTFSGGLTDAIISENYVYSSRVFNVSDDEGFYIRQDGDRQIYGSTYLPELNPNTSFTEIWGKVSYQNELIVRGRTTFTVSGIEVLETLIGPVEVFRIGVENYAETLGVFEIVEEVNADESTVWVHPKIGVLKYDLKYRADDSPSTEQVYTEGEVLLEIRSTNILLPQ